MTEDNINEKNIEDSIEDNIEDNIEDSVTVDPETEIDDTEVNRYYYKSKDNGGHTLTDDEFRKHIADRRRRMERKRNFKKTRTFLILIVVFIMLFTMCGRDIVRLKTENLKLRKQQQELTAERDRLQKELEDTDNKEYLQDQARKQLRLLSEGEILFLFGDDDTETEEDVTEDTEKDDNE
jgi:cell division protein DivIC